MNWLSLIAGSEFICVTTTFSGHLILLLLFLLFVVSLVRTFVSRLLQSFPLLLLPLSSLLLSFLFFINRFFLDFLLYLNFLCSLCLLPLSSSLLLPLLLLSLPSLLFTIFLNNLLLHLHFLIRLFLLDLLLHYCLLYFLHLPLSSLPLFLLSFSPLLLCLFSLFFSRFLFYFLLHFKFLQNFSLFLLLHFLLSSIFLRLQGCHLRSEVIRDGEGRFSEDLTRSCLFPLLPLLFHLPHSLLLIINLLLPSCPEDRLFLLKQVLLNVTSTSEFLIADSPLETPRRQFHIDLLPSLLCLLLCLFRILFVLIECLEYISEVIMGGDPIRVCVRRRSQTLASVVGVELDIILIPMEIPSQSLSILPSHLLHQTFSELVFIVLPSHILGIHRDANLSLGSCENGHSPTGILQ
ncbi:hypothetical protein PENTCL1PPCAC_22471, partial [Pristionchus entomophagus]